MDKLGLILLVFSFVLFCIAAWHHAEPYYGRFVAAGLAFLTAAMLFGNIGTVFKNTQRRVTWPQQLVDNRY
jgi:cell division protein FtsW (lipid II flippase)